MVDMTATEQTLLVLLCLSVGILPLVGHSIGFAKGRRSAPRYLRTGATTPRVKVDLDVDTLEIAESVAAGIYMAENRRAEREAAEAAREERAEKARHDYEARRVVRPE